MPFAHDTAVSLQAAAALVNTVNSAQSPDTMTTVADLDEFYGEWEYTGRREGTQAELDEVRALRPRLRELLLAERDHAVELVNAMLREGRALPQLVRHDDWDWHLHAVEPDAPVVTRICVETAMAMIDVIRADELQPPGRLRRRGLRRRRRGPLAQPVQAVLLGGVRQPQRRGRLPRAPVLAHQLRLARRSRAQHQRRTPRGETSRSRSTTAHAAPRVRQVRRKSRARYSTASTRRPYDAAYRPHSR